MTLLERLKNNSTGLTLMELSISIAVVGIIAGIAVPSYIGYRNNAKISTAINKMKIIEFDITDYVSENEEYPDSLSDIGKDDLTDPWGIPIILSTGYEETFSKKTTGETTIKGYLRKPINLNELTNAVRKTIDENQKVCESN
ncbi:prepilin-type N-terminal cleavage/methylation domain-containing protein [Thermodesulfobacteriota bacterium]